jgi:steroid delta-isomerase-like uncharacterized protein
MTREQMDELIEAHVEAEIAGDVDAAVAVYTPDAEHDVVGWPNGPTTGTAAAAAFYDALMADFATETMERVRGYHGDDFCVTEHRTTGTVPGSLLGIPGHGRRVAFRMLHVWEFRDGAISRENIWLDTSAIVAQLSASPTDGPTA